MRSFISVCQVLLVIFTGAYAGLIWPRSTPKTTYVTATYDNVPTKGGFIGVNGEALPNPYEGLTYTSKVSAIALSKTVLSNLNPPTPPNVIQINFSGTREYEPAFAATKKISNLTLDSLSYACAVRPLGGNVPEIYPCKIVIGCSNFNKKPVSYQTLTYPGGKSFAHAKLANTFKGLNVCGFNVYEAGPVGNYKGPISLLLDNVQYFYQTK